MKTKNQTMDAVSYVIRKRINDKAEKSRVLESELMECRNDIYYDLEGFTDVILVFVFRRFAWSAYISAVITVLLSIFLLRNIFRHIRESLDEIPDRTIAEEYQLHLTSLPARSISCALAFSVPKQFCRCPGQPHFAVD